ncbi:hypothetical protein HY029_02675 [Candidatus Gottesmanbacteria bacterium]|nr:hypothetical protein [Candidatus Gottesmanbacteria bacterium]
MGKKLFILGIVFSCLSLLLSIFFPYNSIVTQLENSSGKIIYPKLTFIDIIRNFLGIAYLLIVLYFLLNILYGIFRFLKLTIGKKREEAESSIKMSLFSLIYAVILIFLWIITGIIPRILGIHLL